MERSVLRGGIRTTFQPGAFEQTSERINLVFVSCRGEAQGTLGTPEERADAGRFPFQRKGSNKVFVSFQVGGLRHGGTEGRVTHRCHLNWTCRLLELLLSSTFTNFFELPPRILPLGSTSRDTLSTPDENARPRHLSLLARGRRREFSLMCGSQKT